MAGRDAADLKLIVDHGASLTSTVLVELHHHIGDTQVMASDGRCQGKAKFDGVMLSISAEDKSEAERIFNALADGGKVQMPLAKTFFSPASACSRTASA